MHSRFIGFTTTVSGTKSYYEVPYTAIETIKIKNLDNDRIYEKHKFMDKFFLDLELFDFSYYFIRSYLDKMSYDIPNKRFFNGKVPGASVVTKDYLADDINVLEDDDYPKYFFKGKRVLDVNEEMKHAHNHKLNKTFEQYEEEHVEHNYIYKYKNKLAKILKKKGYIPYIQHNLDPFFTVDGFVYTNRLYKDKKNKHINHWYNNPIVTILQ